MHTEDRILLLQAMPFFGAISNDSIALILDNSETQSLKQGEYFFHQDDYGDALYLLEKGRVVIFKQDHSKDYTFRYVEVGDCFGELALIDLSPRFACAKAEMPCTAIRIPASTLHTLYQQDPEQFLIIQMNIARELSRRLRKSDERWFQLQVTSSHFCS